MKSVAPVWLFQLQGIESHQGLDLPEDAHRKIMVNYLAAGDDAKAGSYRDFVTNMLINTANKL